MVYTKYMSEFGDKTPFQEMLDWTKYVQEEFSLTDEEMIIVVQTILGHLIDPYQQKYYTIRQEKQK